MPLNPAEDRAWEALRPQWNLAAEATYLNHGAFGPSPLVVREARAAWIERIETEPTDFFERHLEEELHRVADRLGTVLGTSGRNLILVDNATAAMNIVAASMELHAGDEVLLNDHEYGAVARIWQQRCEQSGAVARTVTLPTPLTTAEEFVQRLFAAVTRQTRLLVISHVTSKTAVVFPIEAICQRAHQQGIAVCVDGPHALAMRPLDLDALEPDFYTVSCHKWLSGPFGTGLLYAHPRVQHRVRPQLISWGIPPAGARGDWRDEFIWLGTRDPSGFLALPAAIDFLESLGWDAFRQRTHALARYARLRLEEFSGQRAVVPDALAWYGSMAAVPLAPGDPAQLHHDLWQHHHVEVPVSAWQDARLIRVSCHAYTTRADIDRLIEALAKELR